MNQIRERVSEAFANYSSNSVTDDDLLSLLLGRQMEISVPLQELARLNLSELRKITTPKKAVQLAAAFEIGRRASAPREREVVIETPRDVAAYMRPRLAHLPHEVFHVMLLDTRHRLVADRRVAQGGLATCAISPRDVFEPAIREAAPAMVFVHNHPSGDPTPSRDDVLLTRRLHEASKLLGISLIDHVVVADGGYASLAEMGKL